MKKNILSMSIAFLLTLSATTASADVGNLMANMFSDTATNTTPGEVFETQRGGVMVGGRFTAKNHITRNMQIVGFVPPSISAGCGGISVFGGSFSFINGDQLVSYLRDIGTNAVGYFFQLALESSCPTCAQIMNSLNDLANEVNGQLGDSCSMAKRLVQGSGLGSVAKSAGKAVSAVFDGVGSPSNTQINDPHDMIKSKQEAAKAADELRIILDVNIVYQKMKNAGFDSWQVGTPVSDLNKDSIVTTNPMPTLSEMAMSLVGTTIMHKTPMTVVTKGDAPKTNKTETLNKIVPANLPPIIDFEDFWGRDTNGATTGNYTAKLQEMEFYRCAGTGTISGSNLAFNPTGQSSVNITNNEKCTYVVKQKTSFKPFREILMSYLSGNSNSLAVKIRTRKADNTMTKENYDRLRNIMTTIESPVFGQLQKLSLHKDAASTWVSNSADFIALSYTSGMLNQILDAIMEADAIGSSYNNTLIANAEEKARKDLETQLVNDPIIERILEIREKIDKEYKNVQSRFDKQAAQQIVFSGVIQSILERMGQQTSQISK